MDTVALTGVVSLLASKLDVLTEQQAARLKAIRDEDREG